MKRNIAYSDIPLECYKNGAFDIYSFEQAHRELWNSHYGWIVPSDTYVWNIEGYRGRNPKVFKAMGKPSLKFGFLIHTNSGQPFTLLNAETQLNGKKEFDSQLFVVRAARFNLIFKKDFIGKLLPKRLWPFFYLEVLVDEDGLTTMPAYKMQPGRNCFVVAGVDRDSPYKHLPIPWSLLMEKSK